jgi:hypothetical protein
LLALEKRISRKPKRFSSAVAGCFSLTRYITGVFYSYCQLCKLNPTYLKFTWGKKSKQTKPIPSHSLTKKQLLEHNEGLTIIRIFNRGLFTIFMCANIKYPPPLHF